MAASICGLTFDTTSVSISTGTFVFSHAMTMFALPARTSCTLIVIVSSGSAMATDFTLTRAWSSFWL